MFLATVAIVLLGFAPKWGCRSDHPKYQYRSKPIYYSFQIFPTMPRAKIRSPWHMLAPVPMPRHHCVAFVNDTEGCKGSGLVRRPAGMSQKAGGQGRNQTTQQSTGWNTQKKVIHTIRWSGVEHVLSLSLACYCMALWLIGWAAKLSWVARRPTETIKYSNNQLVGMVEKEGDDSNISLQVLRVAAFKNTQQFTTYGVLHKQRDGMKQ